MRFEFYKNSYYQELNRKNQLNKALSLPIGISTILGSIIYFYAKSIIQLEYHWLFWVYIILLIISLYCFGYSIFRIIKSYYNYSFRFIPTDDEWENHHTDLLEYHDDKDNSANDLEEAIIKELTKSQSINSKANDMKSYHLHKANGGIIITLIFVILTSIPFLTLYKYDSNNTLKSKIISIMCEEPKNQNDKPKAPEGRMIKEGEKPPKEKSESSDSD